MKYLPLAALTLIAAPLQAADPVTGHWLTAEKDSIIVIGRCGTTVCGKVQRVLKMMSDGAMPIDKYNPDPALRNKPVQGMVLLTGFTDGGKLWNGRIYDPKTGKTYKSKLSRNPDGTLKVQGCIGFLCKSFTWTAAK